MQKSAYYPSELILPALNIDLVIEAVFLKESPLLLVWVQSGAPLVQAPTISHRSSSE